MTVVVPWAESVGATQDEIRGDLTFDVHGKRRLN
jgi:hypothetical protein